MAKALIQSRHSHAFGTSAFAALLGFEEMGLEIVLFEPENLLGIKREAADIVVGGVGVVRDALNALGRDVPEICYPEELKPFLGRNVWRSTINAVNSRVGDWPVFVKPVRSKLFTGRLVASTKDLIGCGTCGMDAEVYCSQPISFIAEWRCFVMRGQILDVRPYRGDWRARFDPSVIESAVAAYSDAPAGYGMDFGVTEDGRTLLIEVNDGYALGSYGLEYHAYARLLSARWAELAGVDDPCDFGPLPEPLL
ncbi:ATP-grasp domain-containing protein [uncultured Enorma sp.]|uniref:ATP-grasp domain-containing protein n=1 Tax=uncultured Enorma sp. TaxID=1714346 RepID=UPI0025942F0F|nr:ATP-grasp domain-containing protein [uncultured Enorma sp.]